MTELSKKLDVRGLHCPQPILRTRADLKKNETRKSTTDYSH